MPQTPRWYALQVKSRQERIVDGMLRLKGYETFLPTERKTATVKRESDLPLFPGYLFCRLDPMVRMPVLTTPGVVSILGYGKVPSPVSEDEINNVRMVVCSGLPHESMPYVTGERIKVTEGVLRDLQGVLLEDRNRSRVVVSVELLQRSVAVDISRDWICASA